MHEANLVLWHIHGEVPSNLNEKPDSSGINILAKSRILVQYGTVRQPQKRFNIKCSGRFGGGVQHRIYLLEPWWNIIHYHASSMIPEMKDSFSSLLSFKATFQKCRLRWHVIAVYSVHLKGCHWALAFTSSCSNRNWRLFPALFYMHCPCLDRNWWSTKPYSCNSFHCLILCKTYGSPFQFQIPWYGYDIL